MPKNPEDIPVIINPSAYYRMLVHVLRFGSKVKDPNQCKEVMGCLVGHLKDISGTKNLIIEDAIPVSHGGAIEVRFSPEQLGAFGEIDNKIFEQHGDEGWFTCGWYHSHPNISPFFSGTDIQNQLFWQAKNPSGVGLVFDHEYLEREGDLGFRAFRLDDPSKSRNSAYHEIKATVETPKSVDFYHNAISLIKKVHSKEPPILELNETTDYFEDIFIPESESLLIKKPEMNVEKIIVQFKSSLNQFIDKTINPLMQLLNSWSQDTLKKTYYNNSQMRKDLAELKANLSKSVTEMQKSFNYDLHDELGKLNFYVDDKLDIMEENKEQIVTIVESYEEKSKSLLSKIFEEQLKPIFSKYFNDFNTILSELEKQKKGYTEVINNLEKSNIYLQELFKMIEPTRTRIKSGLGDLQEGIIEKTKKKLKVIETKYEYLDKESKKVVSDLKAATLVLESSRDPILNKIEKLELDKKNLLDTVKELKGKNQELTNKVKFLEKKG
jgi:proteasome lid subunit RPN8/RPN11/uncharacterized FlaG/YvyC family protein